MSVTRRWDLTVTALSPVSHRTETVGTTSLLRRTKVVGPDGGVELVPVVSGNSFRGVLRRLGEELLGDVLEYEGQLPLSVAHILRNGGAIVRSSAEPITGARLRELRSLVPLLSVFGGAVGAAPIAGCLQVGHVVPVIEEARPLLRGEYPSRLPSRFDVESLDSYSHLDDAGHGAAQGDSASMLMRFEVEAFAAGTRFESWVNIARGSELDHAFVVDVLAEFVRRGWLGGRSAIGHGQVRTVANPDLMSEPVIDWRAHIRDSRDEVMAALAGLER